MDVGVEFGSVVSCFLAEGVTAGPAGVLFFCCSASALDSAVLLLVVAELVVSVELSAFSEAGSESVFFAGASTALRVFLSDVTSRVVLAAAGLLSGASAASGAEALERVFVSAMFVVVLLLFSAEVVLVVFSGSLAALLLVVAALSVVETSFEACSGVCLESVGAILDEVLVGVLAAAAVSC